MSALAIVNAGLNEDWDGTAQVAHTWMDELVNTASLCAAVVSTLASPHSRRIYRHHLERFLSSGHRLTREGVAAYLSSERDRGLQPAGQMQLLAAVKKLASEARIRGLLDPLDEYAIQQLKPDKQLGSPSGNWLTLDQAKRLLALPDQTKLAGLRDMALFALLLGCGLRREEAISLKWSQFQERDGRAVLVDINGKGRRKRTIPVAKWATEALERWQAVSHSPFILVSVDEQNRTGSTLSAPGVWDIVRRYAKRLGVDLAPHDLRRTLAQLMHKAGVELSQIQHTLGHASIKTTEVYLHSALELERGKAGVDQVVLA